jgi:hypothetical protein
MAENGMHISGRTIAAIIGIAAVVTATWGAATFVAAQTSRIATLEQLRSDDNLRWCRLERALKLEPWHTCPAAVNP